MNTIYFALFVAGLSIQALCGALAVYMAMVAQRRTMARWNIAAFWLLAAVQIGRAINRALVIPVLQARAADGDPLTLFVGQIFPLVLSTGMLVFVVMVYLNAIPRVDCRPD